MGDFNKVISFNAARSIGSTGSGSETPVLFDATALASPQLGLVEMCSILQQCRPTLPEAMQH
eukprot:10961302-Karenia_brevis.AAC.1